MSSSRRCAPNNASSSGTPISSGSGSGRPSPLQILPAIQSKHSPSLYSMRGKSWSCFHKFISNILAEDNTLSPLPADIDADVQRLDIKDYGLYGIDISEPGPMVLCNQCNHIMAPEGILRHVKKVHGSKLVSMYKARPPIATTTKPISSLSSTVTSASNLATAFSNRLNVSKMAPPTQSNAANNSMNSVTDIKHSKYKVPNNFEEAHVLLNKEDVHGGINSASCSSGVASTSTSSLQLTTSNLQSVSASSNSSNSSGISSSSNSNSSSSSSFSKSSTMSNTLTNSGSGSGGGGGGGSSGHNRRNRKVLPIKDREYDPEKHCGVVIGLGRPCTRSLTCKTHQISLRRNVGGRSKPFDKLLSEHRNHTKDSPQKLMPNSFGKGTGKQANLSSMLMDNSNQLMLIDSIMDSNSSSSFDLERRSVSSNSNHSSTTIGNYNTDLSYMQSQSIGSCGTVAALSSTSVSSIAATSKNASNLPFDTHLVPKGSPKTSQYMKSDKKSSNYSSHILSNSTKLGTMPAASTNTASKNKTSARTLGKISTKMTKMDNSLPSIPTTTSISIALNDYSMQMHNLNDLIDEHGDGLDMGFWEDFDNTPYDSHIMANDLHNLPPPSQPMSTFKNFSKRPGSHNQLDIEHHIERKRRRVTNDNTQHNIPHQMPTMLGFNTNTELASTANSRRSIQSMPDQAVSRIAAEIAFTSASYDSKLPSNIDMSIDNLLTLQSPTARTVNMDNCDTNGELNMMKNRHSIMYPHTAGHKDFQEAAASRTPKFDHRTLGQDVICIDDDDDDNNNLDSTANKNGESTRKMSVIPSSNNRMHQLNMGNGKNDTDEGNESSKLPAALALMKLTTDKSMVGCDLATVSRLLAEKDHLPQIGVTASSSADSKSNNNNKNGQCTLSSVPLDENENYILDLVYKCIRGRNISNVNAAYAANPGARNVDINMPTGDPSRPNNTFSASMLNSAGIVIGKEKENSLESNTTFYPCDEDLVVVASCAPPPANPTSASANSLLLPSSQRHSSKSAYNSLPKPIDVNHFSMAKGRGVAQLKKSIDGTKKAQQQIYHGFQAQQHNGGVIGSPFANASLIALRNNGRFGNNIITGFGIASIAGLQVGMISKGPATLIPSPTIVSTMTTATNKPVSKKPNVTSTVTSSSNTTSDTSASSSQYGINPQQQYAAIMRRPIIQPQLQLLTSRTDQSGIPIMPVIHRVQSRTMLPVVPKNIQAQTAELLQKSSKSLQLKLRDTTIMTATQKTNPTINAIPIVAATPIKIIVTKSLPITISSAVLTTSTPVPTTSASTPTTSNSSATRTTSTYAHDGMGPPIILKGHTLEVVKDKLATTGRERRARVPNSPLPLASKHQSKSSSHNNNHSKSSSSSSSSTKHSKQNGHVHSSHNTTNSSNHVSKSSSSSSSHSSHHRATSSKSSSSSQKSTESLLITKQHSHNSQMNAVLIKPMVTSNMSATVASSQRSSSSTNISSGQMSLNVSLPLPSTTFNIKQKKDVALDGQIKVTNLKKDSNFLEAEQCVICSMQKRCVVFVDCKHYCICLACSKRFSSTAAAANERCCPVCRTPIKTNPMKIINV